MNAFVRGLFAAFYPASPGHVRSDYRGSITGRRAEHGESMARTARVSGGILRERRHCEDRLRHRCPPSPAGAENRAGHWFLPEEDRSREQKDRSRSPSSGRPSRRRSGSGPHKRDRRPTRPPSLRAPPGVGRARRRRGRPLRRPGGGRVASRAASTIGRNRHAAWGSPTSCGGGPTPPSPSMSGVVSAERGGCRAGSPADTRTGSGPPRKVRRRPTRLSRQRARLRDVRVALAGFEGQLDRLAEGS